MNFLMRAAVIAALLHITPVVVLVKRPDAVQTLLPGADAYVASEVHLSAKDAHRLHQGVDWSPEDGVLVFYGARRERRRSARSSSCAWTHPTGRSKWRWASRRRAPCVAWSSRRRRLR